MLKKSLLLSLTVILIQILNSEAFNCTSSELTIPVDSNNWRVVYVFNCFPITSSNPVFPTTFSSQASKYNEIDLSPNVFTSIPISQLCQFKFLNSVDLSFNSITSATNAFKDLACLNNLKYINLANNQISTAIVFSDFDDLFSSQIESLNFTNNQIPYIQTAVFFRGDGVSRFPNLKYLGLANNKLSQFDLLWPISLPSQTLFIDMKLNPITSLTNELKLTYNNILFKYPMVYNRKLDITTNSLQYLDDTNILQYGIYSENDLRDFLYKISNYDFRQSNLVPTFICYCPPYGQLTVYWYKKISNLIDKSAPIYQLYCNGFEGLVYVFDFPCSFTTKYTGPVTTTYSTLEPLIIPNPNITATSRTTTTTTRNVSAPIAGNQFANNQTLANSLPNQIDNNYFFLFFLFIPFFLILTLIFICCIGRCCQVRTNSWCNLICCPCFRPHDESKFTGKYYDATVCYNRFDERWLDELFIPEITHYENNFKIHKLSVHSRSGDKLNVDNEKILRASKRIILVFSMDFLEHDFKNKNFLNLLREIKHDPNCVIIALNKDLDKTTFKYCVNQLNYVYIKPDGSGSRSCLSAIKSRIKYNCGLKEVEVVHLRDRNFWRKFFYMMPFIGYDNTKPAIITDSRKRTDFRLPKLQTKSNPENDSDDYIKKKYNSQLSYASDYKNSKSLRHVIIPIPEFMRTSLGFDKNKKTHVGNEMNENRNSSQTNIFNYQQQDDVQKNIFSTIPYSATRTPEQVTTRFYKNQKETYSTDDNVKSLKSAHYEDKIATVQERASLQIKNYLPSDRDVTIMNKPERSETPDLLSMFAPKPNTVIQMKKKTRRSSRSSRTNINEENDD